MGGLCKSCSHVASLMWVMEAGTKQRDSVTVTDNILYWVLPSAVKTVPNVRFKDANFSNISKAASCIETSMTKQISVPNKDELTAFYSSLASCSTRPVILSLVDKFSSPYVPKSLAPDLPPVLSELCNEEILQHASTTIAGKGKPSYLYDDTDLDWVPKLKLGYTFYDSEKLQSPLDQYSRTQEQQEVKNMADGESPHVGESGGNRGRCRRRCVAAGCIFSNRDGVNLHSFPLDRPAILKQWVTFVKVHRKDWEGPTQRSVLCSSHFTPECYPLKYRIMESLGQNIKRKELEKNAIPTVHASVSPCTGSVSTFKAQDGNRKRISKHFTSPAPLSCITPKKRRGAFEKSENQREVMLQTPRKQSPKSTVNSSVMEGLTRKMFYKNLAETFTEEKEVELVKCLKTANEVLNGLSQKEARKLVYDFAVRYDIHFPIWDVDKLASVMWVKEFIKKNPCISLRKTNSRVPRIIASRSLSINHIVHTVPKLNLPGFDNKPRLITKENPIRCDSNHSCCHNNFISPQSLNIGNDHTYAAIKEVSHVNLSSVELSWGESYTKNENSQSEVNFEEKVFEIDTVAQEINRDIVKEEEDIIVKEEDLSFKEQDYLFIKQEEDIFINYEEDGFEKEEDVHINKDNIHFKEDLLLKEKYSLYLKEEQGMFKNEGCLLSLKEEEDVFVKEEITDAQVI